MSYKYLALSAMILSACATAKGASHTSHGGHDQNIIHSHVKHESNSTFDDMPPGSNLRLRAPITISDDLEVIISDVVIPPNGTVPAHYHPGEEFLYLIEGSAIHIQQGQPDQTLRAGDAYVIPPEAVHAPRGGPDGARAIVFRVHRAGSPERVLVDE